LTRNPYVNLVTPNSALIAWHTDTATTGTVVYSEDLSYGLSETDATSDTIHAVTLTGLTPGTIYFYRVVAGTDTLTAPSDYFQTAPTPSPGAEFSFAALGDLGAATTAQQDVATTLGSFAPQFAILTGDIIYEAGEAANFDPQYFRIYQPTLALIPFYTALGNHDLLTANGQAYLDNFYLPTNSATNSERYYSFDYGNAHFVCLEVTQENTTPDATMLTWLDQDLAGSSQLWKIVFFHVPAYSNDGGHGGDLTIAAALEPIFMNRGVDLVFQGHNHFYTRTYPLVNGAAANTADEPNYYNPSGPIWITTGGGGRVLYPIVTPLSSIEAFSVSDYHFVYVFITGPVLALDAVASDGTSLDTASIVKTPTTAITFAGLEAIGEPDGVRLRWQRTDGGNEGGFNVYRAIDAGGPWTKLNAALLRGSSSFEYLDRDGEPGVAYTYRLGMVDAQGNETATQTVSASRQGPLRFALERPRPNPSRGSAVIPFTLDRPALTHVFIVDVAGRVVRNLASRILPAGAQALTWDGRDAGGRAVASGIYFAVVRTDAHEARTRVALLR
ncbi:MAG TPA: metallophosphoesterase, partial [Thermoanaerobaculia bacterium]|nr:metallophosphoesterase [Thermoanaerobaculia bacterium]